jgi:hypothetical protein
MHDERQNTTSNAGRTTADEANAGRAGTNGDEMNDAGVAGLNEHTKETPEALPGHDEQAGKGIGGPAYNDDGVLAEQTPGLDPETIRHDAGPDWPADAEGDLEADTSPGGGSGARQGGADTASNR